MVKDFEQSHLIPPKMQTKLEISRQAELFPYSGFFQPRKRRSFLRHRTRRSRVKAATVDFALESDERLLEQPFADRPAAFHCSHAETWQSRQTVESYSGRPSLSFVELPAKSVRKPPGSTMVTLTPAEMLRATTLRRNLQRPILQPSRVRDPEVRSFPPIDEN